MAMFIDCVQTGAQNHAPNHDIDEPQMKAWRCDLTALSQVYNLYFVACNDTIRVYRPEFPDQTFEFEPSLILQPPISSPYLSPYIDENDPHSITRILVMYLGNDEILLATCDDGDVIGYRIEEIHRALTCPHLDDEFFKVRTFLHRNVGASAWGLAVHREARIIAISANTHEITVLAYALANQGGGSDLLGADEEVENDFPAPRTRDHVFTLKASHNVPSVSFNNTSEDPEGRWLFSTCINGEVRLWDLHHPSEPSRIFEMGFCHSAKEPGCAPRTAQGNCSCSNHNSFPHGTWGAMWIDRHAAYEIDAKDEDREAIDDAPFFHDAEKQKDRFRGNEKDVDEEMKGYFTSDEGSEMELSDYDSDYDPESEGGHMDSHVAPELQDEHMSLGSHSDSVGEDEADVDSDEDSTHDNNTATYAGPPLPPMQTPAHDSPAFQQVWDSIMHTFELNALATGPNDSGDENDEEDDDNEQEQQQQNQDYVPFPNYFANALRYPGIIRPKSPTPYCQITTSNYSPSSPKQPALIISQDAVFLLSPSLSTPILTLRRPLHPFAHSNANAYVHRLCFSQSIPELGAFIIASPVGRVGIFAITKSKSTSPSSTSSKSGDDGDWRFGFRLEHILPVTSPDRLDGGWGKRLVGVAVGPVQGMFDAEGKEWGWGERRWRVLMYFTDHSVLGFELSRKRGGSEEVGELVV